MPGSTLDPATAGRFASTRLCTEPSAKRVTSSSPRRHVTRAAHQRTVGPQGQAVAAFELALHVVGVEQAAHGAHALLGPVEVHARCDRQARRRASRTDASHPSSAAGARRASARPCCPGAHRACAAGAVPPRPSGRRADASRASASARNAGTRRASASAGAATCALHHCRVDTAMACPHSVGVMQERAATMSATVSSPVCPMPVKTGLLARRHGAGHDLGLERGQVRPGTAAAHQGDDVAVTAAQEAQRPGDGRRRVRPLHRARGRKRRGNRNPTRSGDRGSRCSPRSRGWRRARCAW